MVLPLERTEMKTWIVLLYILFCVALSGCAVLEAARDILMGKPDSNIVPTTSKEQLWVTIKGLTPNWLAIPIIALGAVAVFNGAAKLGISCVIFGSTNLFMALATSRFGLWMAVFGLVGSMAAVGASILTKNKAIRELVFNGQQLKEEVITELHMPRAKEIFAKQVKATKKIVQQIKNKAKLKGEM